MNNSKTSLFEKPMLSTKIKSANVKLPEIFFGYFLGPMGALLASGIFTSFLNKYWTEVLFAGELEIASVKTFLTLLPLLSAILIVAGNLVAGQIIERTRTKAGKARPWILLSAVLLTVTCILMFISPAGGRTGKMALTALSYNLYYAVAYPLYNTANSTLIPVSTRNSKQRGLLASATNVAGLAVMGAGSMVFPVLLGLLVTADTTPAAAKNYWLMIFVVVGIITFVACLLQYYFTRERVTEEAGYTGAAVKKLPMSKQVKAVASDKFWWIIIVFYFLFQLSGAVKNLSMTYFCSMIVDNSFWGANLDPNTAAGMTQTLLAVLGAIPMALAVVAVWPLSNKFGKQRVTLAGMAVGVIGGVIAGIGSESVVLVGIGVALKCLGSAPASYMILAMISDALDHIEAKKGFRCDGLTMSIYSSIMVAATPIGQAIFNGISGSGTNAAAVSVSYIWIETIAYGLCAALMIFFAVEKGLPDDQAAIKQRQKEEAIANGEEWIEPEERLRREEAESDRLAEEARKAELKARCERKGLSFEEEEAKYQAALAEKRRKAEEKKRAREEKDKRNG